MCRVSRVLYSHLGCQIGLGLLGKTQATQIDVKQDALISLIDDRSRDFLQPFYLCPVYCGLEYLQYRVGTDVRAKRLAKAEQLVMKVVTYSSGNPC